MREWLEEYDGYAKAAVKMRKRSYAPYSHYCVGAALVTVDGEVYTGCNIENAAYSPGNCAERTAIFKAVSEGKRDFRLIVITGGEKSMNGSHICTPCGMCRQVIREFCRDDFLILCPEIDEEGRITDHRIYTLKELLPDSFGPENLGF